MLPKIDDQNIGPNCIDESIGSNSSTDASPVTRAQDHAETQSEESPRRLSGFGITRYSLLMLSVVLVVAFSLWVPQTFLTVATLQFLLNQNSPAMLLALAILVPLSAGVFDLSIGYTMGLGGAITGVLVANHGATAPEAVAAAILVGLVVGSVNGIVVVKLKIDSFIGTLGTGSIIVAVTLAVTNNQQIVLNIPHVLGTMVNASFKGLTIPFFIALFLTISTWYVLEHTALGRYIYATGFNKSTSKLAGVQTDWLRMGAFVWSATLASIAGLLVTGVAGSVDPTVGPSYLLPAFAAVFLGTSFHRWGRFNTMGTVMAVVLLGIAEEGLALTSSPVWTPEVFNGAALIIALGISGIRRGDGS